MRHVLEAAQQAGGKAVADVLQQGADGVGARVGTPQVAGREVVLVAELADGALDAGAHVDRDAGLAVDHTRHRLQAHPGQRRHVAHGGAGATGRSL